jgi:hypothetical protein
MAQFKNAVTPANVMYGEIIMPSTDNLPTMRQSVKTRMAIKTTVMVAEAQVKVAHSIAEVEVLRRDMREHEDMHELRLKQLNHAHAKFDMVAEHELRMLRAELDAIEGKK